MKKLIHSISENSYKTPQHTKPRQTLLKRLHQMSLACILPVCFVAGAMTVNADPLIDAISNNDVKKVEQLIQEGANVNAMIHYGYTPFLQAICWGQSLGIINALIKAGADLNSKTSDGRTPLHCAAGSRNPNPEIVNLLIKEGADLNAKTSDGHTPLHCAAEGGNSKIVDTLIKAGADLNAKNIWGDTPLHNAASRGYRKVANVLIQAGADVTVKNEFGGTPLDSVDTDSSSSKEMEALLQQKGATACYQNLPIHQAVQDEDTKQIEMLIKSGADINARNKEGKTPLILIVKQGNPEITNMLIKAGANVNAKTEEFWVGNGCGITVSGITPLHIAARSGYIEIANQLIKAGAIIDAKTKRGETPLYHAALWGEVKMFNLLLKAGADINHVKNHENERYFLNDVACPYDPNDSSIRSRSTERNLGRLEIINILIKAGLDINSMDNYAPSNLYKGHTPLGCTMVGGTHSQIENIVVAKALIQAGADVNAKNIGGKTLLHIACSNPNTYGKTARILIKAGANVNAKDKNGNTPLHYAAQYGYPEMCQVLIKAGADVNAKNKENTTPLLLASQKLTSEKNPQEDLVNLINILIKAGATVDGDRVLHRAIKKETAEKVSNLVKAGADVHAKSQLLEDTPLHRTALMGKTKIAGTLIKAKADVNAKNKLGNTPLHYAAQYGYPEMCQVLIKAGADVNAKNKENTTPLLLASQKGFAKTAEILIKAGAEVNAKDKWNMMIPAKEGHTAVCQVLLKAGVDINDMLRSASECNQIKTVQWLIKAGADVNSENEYGRTPLNSAISAEMCQLLLKAGADVNAKNKDGKTPLDFAIGEDPKVITLLRQNGAKRSKQLNK